MFSRTILADKRTEKISTHQRLLRAARRQTISLLPPRAYFPSAKQLVHFEGKNGPDGLPSKHAVQDYPHEFIDPNVDDRALVNDVMDHLHQLKVSYHKHDEVRTAFELAWVEHLVVDGLTPAHHQPFQDQIKTIDPRTIDETNSILKRIFTPGDGTIDTLKRNYKRLGPGGIGSSHILFEAGIELIVMPLPAKRLMSAPSKSAIQSARRGHFPELYLEGVHRVNDLHIFERYLAKGWTPDLADDTRRVLLPECVKMITLAWLSVIS
jgi:hypothetical protein